MAHHSDCEMKKNLGYFLESELLQSLKSLDVFDEILVEDNLKQRWGWSASGVDHWLIKGDYVVAIQAKWRCTRRREDQGINNFLKSLEYTLAKSGKKLLFGLWVSRLEPFDDNKARLYEQGVYTISCFDSIDSLVSKAKHLVISKLSSKNINISQ